MPCSAIGVCKKLPFETAMDLSFKPERIRYDSRKVEKLNARRANFRDLLQSYARARGSLDICRRLVRAFSAPEWYGGSAFSQKGIGLRPG
jgi:hypothetical protein